MTSWIGFVKHPGTRTSSRKEAGAGWRAGVDTQGPRDEGREPDHLSAAPSHLGSLGCVLESQPHLSKAGSTAVTQRWARTPQ